MQPLGSLAAVCAAVREDAAAEAERIAREGAAHLPVAGSGPALPPEERAQKLAAARRAAREKLAAEDLFDTRAALEAREAWIAKAIARARELGEPREERRRRIRALVQQANLPPPLTVSLAPADVDLVEGAVADEQLSPGGVRIAGGRLVLDESVEARARRTEPRWRAALARIWG